MKRVAAVLLGAALAAGCSDVVAPVREKTALNPRFNAGSDVSPPVLTAFGLSPSTIDVTAGPANLTVTFAATDDLSGVTTVQAFLESPSGQRTGGGSFPPASTSVSGTFEIVFPQFVEAGTWTVLGVDVRDAVGNSHGYSASELSALGFPNQVTVLSVSDVSKPALTAFSLNPTTVDVSAGPAAVTATFAATDDLSGVTTVQAFLESPSGQRAGGGSFPPASTSVSGTFEIDFRQFAEAGTWTVLGVNVRDAVGNSRDYTSADLAALGFPNQVTVLSAGDVSIPALTAFSLSPSTVDVSAGSAAVTATFAATDDLSGVTTVQAFLDSPSGQRTGAGSFPPAAISVSGTFEIVFPQFAEAGTWTVLGVNVRDAVGNSRDYTAAELAALGFSNTVVVQNAVAVTIDIKPGESPNTLKCPDKNAVTVAILSTSQFDARTVDHTTVTFGPGGAAEVHLKNGIARRHEQDIDGDGDLDLVFHFSVQQAAIVCGSTSAELNGRTFGGTAIRGIDSIVWF